MNHVPLDWNAQTYHRVSGPQETMAREVLDRLLLRGDETVLDAGCGTGRVTALLCARLPLGHVVAVDSSPAMVQEARRHLGPRTDVRLADLTELTLPEPVDAVFSTATFHWIPDHKLLFRRLTDAMKPGGRLVAQCGGEGNSERFLEAVASIATQPPYVHDLAGWESPWRFANPDETEEILTRAGFDELRCRLEARPVVPEEPLAFIETVMLRTHLEHLDPARRRGFVEAVAAALPHPITIDYVRLNIDARLP